MQEYEYIELVLSVIPRSLPGPRYDCFRRGDGNVINLPNPTGYTLLEAYGELSKQGYEPFDKDRPMLLRRPKP